MTVRSTRLLEFEIDHMREPPFERQEVSVVWIDTAGHLHEASLPPEVLLPAWKYKLLNRE